MKTTNSFCALSFAMIAILFAPLPAIAMDASLLEMSEQMDGIDKQDFQSAINKANTCTRARNFPCAESELAKAAKSANSGQDKKTLLASQTGLKNEKQALADEIRRTEEERLAQIRRDEEEEQAQRRNKEEREARAWREKRDAQDAEDRQATSNAWADLGRHIQQQGAEIGATMSTINRQKAAAINDSNRVLAAQAAERERARAEKAEREADRRRDAERDRTARADAQRAADTRQAQENTRIRQQEQERLDKQARLQEQTQLKEQELQQEQTRKQEQERKKAEAEKNKLATKQSDDERNSSQDTLMKSTWGGAKKIVRLFEPCGSGKTESEARSAAETGWSNFKHETETVHERGLAYGRILSRGETTCRTSLWPAGDNRHWGCSVAYTKEVLDLGSGPAKGISR
jgi:hypothetical protein